MKPIGLRLVALISASLLAVSVARASSEPRHGGTLRIELRAPTVNLDPRAWQAGSLESAASEKLASLMFERLLELDNYGRFQPVLAADWSHDPSNKHWQFVIRGGVKFSDGTPLTATDVVAALQPLLPQSLELSAVGNALTIQSGSAIPDLLEQLSSGRYFIYRALPGGALVGTGPFVGAAVPTESTPPPASGSHLFFRANEDAWSGRPFLDAIEVTLGMPALRAMFDLQLGKADLIELAPDLVPRATQSSLRVWTSDPVTLYGLRFDDALSVASDPRLREALSLSLDRASMATVLLQKQAEPASALLPQWLSGYAFLFNADTSLDHARELRRALPANGAGAASPLRLRVDPAGEMAKLLGERVAVNARQASILVQVVSRTGGRAATASGGAVDPPPGTHLFAWRYSSLCPRSELDSMFAAYNLQSPQEAIVTGSSSAASDYEQLYARERRVLEEWRVLPLVQQSEFVGLGASVRNWMPARWGEWHLADVWLDSRPGSPVETGAPAPGVRP